MASDLFLALAVGEQEEWQQKQEQEKQPIWKKKSLSSNRRSKIGSS